MARRHLDLYETNAFAVRALRRRIRISGTVIEPCNGFGAISKMFPDCKVITSDIDPEKPADFHGDARSFDYLRYYDPSLRGEKPWVVTNPPFSIFMACLRPPVELGFPTAFLLRLSALEPTTRDRKDPNVRGEWLLEHQPDAIIVLPRYSYTGDGNTDSVTSAWFLWNIGIGGFVGDYHQQIMVAPETEESAPVHPVGGGQAD